MNITEHSTKAAIIDAACELTDTQAERIAQLEQQQTILFSILGLVAVSLLLF